MWSKDVTVIFTLLPQLAGGGDVDQIGSLGGHGGWSSRDPLPVFSAGGPCEQFWHGQGCPLFGVVHPAFPLLTMASPTLQGALKDSFGEAVMACDMPKLYKFPSLWQLPEEVPVDPQGSWSRPTPSCWSCTPNGRCGEVSSGTWLQNLDPFSQRQQAGSMFHGCIGGWRWQSD